MARGWPPNKSLDHFTSFKLWLGSQDYRGYYDELDGLVIHSLDSRVHDFHISLTLLTGGYVRPIIVTQNNLARCPMTTSEPASQIRLR